MPITIEAKVDLTEVRRAIALLGREGTAALAVTVDRTLAGTRELITDMTRAELNIKAAAVKKRVSVQRNRRALEGKVTVAAKPSPLLDFVGTTFRKRSRGGVAIRIKRGGKRTVLRHAFVLDLASGRRVFERARAGGRFVSRKPLVALTSTFVSQFISGARQIGAITRYVQVRFRREMASQLHFRLSRKLKVQRGGDL